MRKIKHFDVAELNIQRACARISDEIIPAKGIKEEDIISIQIGKSDEPCTEMVSGKELVVLNVFYWG